MVLEDTDRLAEHRPAHVVAGHEVGLGADQLADPPAATRDLTEEQTGHLLGSLATPGSRGRKVGQATPRRPALPQVARLHLQVAAHPSPSEAPVAADDGIDDPRVGLRSLTPAGLGQARPRDREVQQHDAVEQVHEELQSRVAGQPRHEAVHGPMVALDAIPLA